MRENRGNDFFHEVLRFILNFSHDFSESLRCKISQSNWFCERSHGRTHQRLIVHVNVSKV